MGASPTTWRALLAAPAVRFDDHEYDIADLVLLALAEGTWQALHERLSRGLNLEREHGRGVAPARVDDELRRFRYERRLIAGKDLRDWLFARVLDIGALRRHCLRRLLLEAHDEAHEDTVVEGVEAELRVEAICSGTLAGACARLVDLAAMSAGAEPATQSSAHTIATLGTLVRAHPEAGLADLAGGGLDARVQTIGRLLTAEADFVRRTATAEQVRRCVAEHGVDWLRVDCSELTLPSEGAARESMLCLRLDRMPLAHLCELLETAPRSRSHYLDELTDGSAPLLASAAIGDPVGPLQGADGWRVLVVHERVPPDGGDPEVVRRATAALVASARERAKAGRAHALAVL